MTREEVQQQVDKLAQEYIARMQAAHAKRQAELQQQIEECERQQELCRKRLRELEQA